MPPSDRSWGLTPDNDEGGLSTSFVSLPPTAATGAADRCGTGAQDEEPCSFASLETHLPKAFFLFAFVP